MEYIYVGEVTSNEAECKKCGAALWGNNGYAHNDGAVCVNVMRCDMRVARTELNKQAALGIKPRWRRNEQN